MAAMLSRRRDSREVWLEGVGRHFARHRRLARLARLLIKGDRATLAASFPAVAAAAELPLPAAVLIVTADVEQARVLARRLRGWPIITAADAYVESRLRFAHVSGELVTFDALRGLPYVDADVLIRADGGTGALPLAPAALETASGWPSKPLLVVDVDDRHHPELRRRSRARQRAYRDLGWLPVGQDQVDVALDTILELGRS
jgi:hypothetical protein